MQEEITKKDKPLKKYPQHQTPVTLSRIELNHVQYHRRRDLITKISPTNFLKKSRTTQQGNNKFKQLSVC